MGEASRFKTTGGAVRSQGDIGNVYSLVVIYSDLLSGLAEPLDDRFRHLLVLR